MNVLICDDIAKEANGLAAKIAESGFETHISVFTCPWQAFNYIQSGKAVDVCFLDIIMPEMNGIKLAEKLRDSNFTGEIVFLTTSNNFASQSYMVKAFDYLLKPIACEKLNGIMNALQNLRANVDKNGLSVKMNGAVSIIPFRDISHIEADRHIVYINLLDKSVTKTYVAFSKIMEQALSDSRFVKCHRSYIVNLGEIKTILNDEIIMRNNERIPISKGFSQVKDEMIKQMFK
jgi:DNA-binding LytR/AlgR family response regulator